MKYNILFAILLFFGVGVFSNVIGAHANQDNDKCLMINKIVIKGVSVVSASDIQKIGAGFTEQCFKAEKIQELLRKITNYYAKFGYITSIATLPEQNLQSGELIIEVKEGFIENIEINSLSNKYSLLLPIKKQQILSLRDIEQAYDYYNKVKSNDVNITIKPGNLPNSSIILIDNKSSKKWNLSMGADNNGTKQHPTQIYNTLALDNILGLNEQYGFNYRQSIGEPAKKYSNSKGFNFSVPIEYYDFSFSHAKSKDRSLLESHGNNYINRANSTTYQLNVNRLLHRDSSSKTYIFLGLSKDIYTNYLDEYKIQISSYKLSKVDIGVSHQRRLTSSILSITANVINGINKGFYSTFSNINAPTKRYTKTNIDISWIKPLPIVLIENNIQYRLQCFGQHSSNMLAASEKFSLTGLNGVRGFKEYKENTDWAFLMRNELISPVLNLKSMQLKRAIGDISVFVGFDYGYFANYEEVGKRKGALSSFAVGIRNSDGVYNFNITLASPFQAPQNFKYENNLYISVGINI